MTFPIASNNYSLGFGTASSSPQIPVFARRAPTSSDIHYPVGKPWIDQLGLGGYWLASLTGNPIQANWISVGTSGGALNTLTGDSGGAISPSAGNITLAGTGGQLSTTGSGSTITWALSSTLVAPGSLEVTGLLQGDAGATLNTAGTAMNIATDNDGSAVNIGNGTSGRTISIGTSAAANLITIGSATGASSLSLKYGSGNFAINGAVAGTITIGNAAQTGLITLGKSSTTSEVDIASGAGASTVKIAGGVGGNTVQIAHGAGANTVAIADGAAAQTVTIGSLNTSSTLTLQSGTGGISLASGATTAGTISMTPSTSSTAGTSVTQNNRVCVATFTGLTTASAGSQALTVTNSTILATSGIFASIYNLDASGNHAAIAISKTVVAAGSVVVTYINNGAGALGAGDNVVLTLWVIS